MNGKSKVLIAFVVIALLGAFASDAAAKVRVDKATTTSSFGVKGSNGYWIEVKVMRIVGERDAKVTVTASKERYKVELVSAAYSTYTPLSPDGSFDAKLPGLGRIDVKLEGAKVHGLRVDDGPFCTEGMMSVRKGTFRGTITFRGEGGFTKVKRQGAPGQVTESARVVCHEPDREEPAPEEPSGFRTASVFAGARSGGAEISFSAAGPPEENPPVSSGGIPTVAFEARYASERRGVQILDRAYIDTGSNRFLVPGPIGAPTDATVEPSKPFTGTGTFHLESPSTPSWTGDLSVKLPGIGEVALTGPGFTAQLCEARTCVGSRPASTFMLP